MKAVRGRLPLAVLFPLLAVACEPPERIDVGTLGPLIDTRPVVAVRNDRAVASAIRKLEADVLAGCITPSIAADRVLQAFDGSARR